MNYPHNLFPYGFSEGWEVNPRGLLNNRPNCRLPNGDLAFVLVSKWVTQKSFDNKGEILVVSLYLTSSMFLLLLLLNVCVFFGGWVLDICWDSFYIEYQYIVYQSIVNKSINIRVLFYG